MRSSTFYPTRTVSCVVLLLLFMNAFSAWAQKISPASGTCMVHNGTATFTFNGPETDPVWSTRGDIRIVPGTSNTGNTVAIESTGYGKGRVLVSYGTTACGQQSFVDVFKVFEKTVDLIVGPDCVLPNEIVTYSIASYLSTTIAAEIGIDKYTWVVPTDWTIQYQSNDESSITLKAPAVLGNSEVIKVYAGKCNTPTALGGTNAGAGWMYSKAISQKPAKPALVSLPSCVATNAANSTTITLNVLNPEPGVVYTWTLPSNWKFGANTTNQSISNVNIMMDNLTGTIKLTAKRTGATCEAVESTFKITRSVSSTGSALTGLTPCVVGNAANPYMN